jgi:8-oxo-dGTP pyrophosphatase MutT (NUDIX family)
MREIERKIASAIIFSKDHKILMGKKDPAKGGVFSDCWHIPGGGIDEGETLEQALKREVLEETGIDISLYKAKLIPIANSGIAEKTLKTGEKVLCHMEFNVFEVNINDKNAEDIILNPTDDLVEMRWFGSEELENVKQIPGGKEFFIKAGYIKKK